MQISVVQTMPCASEDLAKAGISSMLTQIAGEKGGLRVIAMDIKEVNGMYIAVATYEIPDLNTTEKKADGEKAGEENKFAPSENENDNNEEEINLHADLRDDLPQGQTEPSAFEPTGQSNLVAAPEPATLTPDAPAPSEELLSEKLKDDFVEAKDPYNVDGNALVAERAAEAVSGLSPEEVQALKAEIERRLDEGIDPGIMPPGGEEKPAATPPGTTA